MIEIKTIQIEPAIQWLGERRLGMARPFEPIGSSIRDHTGAPGLKAHLGRVCLRLTAGLVLSTAIAVCVAYVPALVGLILASGGSTWTF
ncbi:hypothetical protein ASD21_07080 [Caulobacter sp. Root1455]|uniref:hypothetical protein n=1 Tax=unclassified Caulobacter TaxID=2648921 RepID=UPI0006F761BE|nr:MULTISPECIES: hypothetical protein [unclassified Caulobacter]KQY30846.1 hypothetical protein ASD38_05630 [Caulobacter sp. Root487D2Y]KQY95123.1 hypothetical protein ASD21_07080 [Caulobacter sp. Root1455]